MLLLVNPLAVALEVDLGGRSGLAVQVDRLVLDYVGLLWFHQKDGQRLRGVRGEGFRQIAEANKVIVNCEERDGYKMEEGRDREMKRKDKGRDRLTREAESPRKGEWMDWERKESRQETVGQCIITAVFAWDYPFAQHTVKSLSFDILECLHKCILERRKFWDSSQAIRLQGFTETGPCLA